MKFVKIPVHESGLLVRRSFACNADIKEGERGIIFNLTSKFEI